MRLFCLAAMIFASQFFVQAQASTWIQGQRLKPRIVRRADRVVVLLWCDADNNCLREPEVIPEKKVKSHFWQFRRHIKVDFDQSKRAK